MKLNRKIIVSFLTVFIMLCGWLTVNAEGLEFSTDKEALNNIIFLEDDDNFTFNIMIDDPDAISWGFNGVLEWDHEAIVIDDIYEAGRRYSVMWNEELGDFIVTKTKNGYVGKEAVITVEGHAIKDGDLTSDIRVTDLKYTDAANYDPPVKVPYTDKEIKVTIRRIVLTPTEIEYHENPTPEISITPVVVPTEEPSATPTEGISEVPVDVPSEAPSDSVKDDEDGKNNGDNGDNNGKTSVTPTTDKSQIPTEKTPQTGTGKTVAFIMGAGIIASAVFYIKFSKNNY